MDGYGAVTALIYSLTFLGAIACTVRRQPEDQEQTLHLILVVEDDTRFARIAAAPGEPDPVAHVWPIGSFRTRYRVSSTRMRTPD